MELVTSSIEVSCKFSFKGHLRSYNEYEILLIAVLFSSKSSEGNAGKYVVP